MFAESANTKPLYVFLVAHRSKGKKVLRHEDLATNRFQRYSVYTGFHLYTGSVIVIVPSEWGFYSIF